MHIFICFFVTDFVRKKINATSQQKFLMEWVQNKAGKEENAGYQHFLLFPHCFQKASFSGSLKVGTVWEGVKGPLTLFQTSPGFYVSAVQVF